MIRKKMFIIAISLFLCSAALAQPGVTTVILVRHAEKSTTPANDPGLTEQGSGRAQILMKMFENSNLSAIYCTQYARTKLTAQPLATKLGLQVQVVDASASKKLVETILTRHAGKSVLVVGHSNTLPEIVAALGAGKMADIADPDYDNLFIVNVIERGKAKLLRMKFFPPAESPLVCQ
jgi:broad specificity phosphatase PhoE